MEKFEMSIDEMRAFFERYSPMQLESFKGMLQLVCSYDKKDALTALDEAFKNQEIKCATPNEFDHSYKIHKLTNKELDFFYMILDDVDFYVGNIESDQYSDEKRTTFLLINSIDKERQKRKSTKHKTFIKQN